MPLTNKNEGDTLKYLLFVAHAMSNVKNKMFNFNFASVPSLNHGRHWLCRTSSFQAALSGMNG